jgi:hypothetical protein
MLRKLGFVVCCLFAVVSVVPPTAADEQINALAYPVPPTNHVTWEPFQGALVQKWRGPFVIQTPLVYRL